jgi:hypothetical protein
VKDDCGVCGGDGSSCAGCDGVANSGKVNDHCGVCGGDGSSCVVRTELTAPGNVDDYDATTKQRIAERFAAAVDGVNAEDVRVTVVSASVKITVDVPVPAAAKASDVAAALAPNFATAEAASTFLAAADVTVESVDAAPFVTVAVPDGCDGVANSGKVNDGCGVCGGDGSSCAVVSVHGRCIGRSCVCKSGWSGMDCTVESLLKKRCRQLRKAIKRVVNAKKRKKRNKRTRKLAKKRTNLQQKGITDATCGLTCVDGTMCVDECGVPIGDGLTCADECGVPNGDDSTCTDACGVPLGDGSTCR